jgi:hypothetical protein
VTSILPFVPRVVFDDEATRLMGEAFDAACKELHDARQPAVVHEVIAKRIHEVIAKRIINAARRGERDPARLRDVALMALARTKRD